VRWREPSHYDARKGLGVSTVRCRADHVVTVVLVPVTSLSVGCVLPCHARSCAATWGMSIAEDTSVREVHVRREYAALYPGLAVNE